MGLEQNAASLFAEGENEAHGEEVNYLRLPQNANQLPFLETPFFCCASCPFLLLGNSLFPLLFPPLRSCWQQLAEPRWAGGWAGGWAGASGAPVSPLPTNPAALGYTVPQALLLPDDCSLCACPSLMLDLAFLQGLFSEWKKESSTIDVNWLLHNGRESCKELGNIWIEFPSTYPGM